MKRRILAIALLISFIIIPIYWKAYASLDAVPLEAYHSPELEKHLQDLPSRPIINQMIYVPSSDFSKKEAASMIRHISNIPPSILDRLVQQNVHLYLFEGKLTDIEGFEHLHGTKPRGYSMSGKSWEEVPGIGGSKLVLAKIGHSKKGMGHGSVNLELHELAHSVDRFVLGNIRYNEVFLEVWKKEVGALFPGKTYFNTFPEEYFAEAFAMYYVNDKTRIQLANQAPKTFLFMQNMEKLPLTQQFYTRKN
ncbi:hypothetical protein FIU87_11625 [Bacillus sp. THAF10]|uniref:anthrax toxin lethal factor-related metalloendopeptidase n=1 Tax=Bacillus sp. THAF10 TaxID=2587848 RepID=UPI001269564A|nr:toxin [Bacillus sp. THAF10]QFT89300.1 hypothetical protein FIU87_11625 [Bacillus sp. THAF10]